MATGMLAPVVRLREPRHLIRQTLFDKSESVAHLPLIRHVCLEFKHLQSREAKLVNKLAGSGIRGQTPAQHNMSIGRSRNAFCQGESDLPYPQ